MGSLLVSSFGLQWLTSWYVSQILVEGFNMLWTRGAEHVLHLTSIYAAMNHQLHNLFAFTSCLINQEKHMHMQTLVVNVFKSAPT